ncbi:MAG: DNA-directed RNA polymerase subunit omega [Candidatus Latescibacteria bacterium]|nr:DNA-directed RNA polymerase subunit omega [Candidatus Latescibacterota bacterium]NIM22577.1 DNA-directed RNA polymerase subunit omega [Candidatus Latescibacterota bacterium]NIM64866.1 DNA-directed RNA polymerase subunit omega [Candidatus Latescibacterota bacterium]NIO01381.1 DNA-directed RNA polymerase subunit omega [Candidatus Latescibacterota bacterium]NIO55442.1 DNA-directed RNA polymerase subunit omega [Candidatus Latescibacterota bacterium]
MKNVVLIDKLTEVVANKYEAVRIMAKEARRINALLVRGAQGEIDKKPTSIALRRLLENKVKYEYVEEEEVELQLDEEEE